MKKMILVTLLIALIGCNKESSDKNFIEYDKIVLTQYIFDNYYEDSRQLYMNEIMLDSTHNNFNNPEINESEVTNILKIIQAVYNIDIPERDTVFNIYQIHSRYCYSFNEISLEVIPEIPEIQNLSSGIIPTGEPDLDNLLSMYVFDSVRTYYNYPDFPWLSIYSQNEYNLIPLLKKFSSLEPVLITDFNKSCIGDGNNITLIRTEESAIITFSIGTGDCPAGCLYHKYWVFEVTEGVASFIETYED